MLYFPPVGLGGGHINHLVKRYSHFEDNQTLSSHYFTALINDNALLVALVHVDE